MNTLAAALLEVKPADLDIAAEDDAFTAYLEAHAEELTSDSEAADMVESFIRF